MSIYEINGTGQCLSNLLFSRYCRALSVNFKEIKQAHPIVRAKVFDPIRISIYAFYFITWC